MVQGRQSDEWSRVAALIGSVNNLFAGRDDRVNIAKFLPQHLQQKAAPEVEESPQVVAANWAAMRAAFRAGKIRGG